jgi:hypothetical protein
MKRLKVVLSTVSVVLLLATGQATAHTVQGHIVISEIAMEQLTTEEQNYFNSISKQLLVQLDETHQKPTLEKYKSASDTALISRFPDDIKKWNLNSLFKKYGSNPPSIYKKYLNNNTANWHYIATPLTGECVIDQPVNIVKMLKVSLKAFTQSRDLKDKALALSFISHLVGDIHQPLHTFNNYSATCESDLGGNKYCIKMNKKGKCTKNLHSLWDDAGGALKESKNIEQVSANFRSTTIMSDNLRAPIKDWVEENRDLAMQAYKTGPLKTPSKKYYQRTQKLLKQRIRTSGDRLAIILKALYKMEHRNNA